MSSVMAASSPLEHLKATTAVVNIGFSDPISQDISPENLSHAHQQLKQTSYIKTLKKGLLCTGVALYFMVAGGVLYKTITELSDFEEGVLGVKSNSPSALFASTRLKRGGNNHEPILSHVNNLFHQDDALQNALINTAFDPSQDMGPFDQTEKNPFTRYARFMQGAFAYLPRSMSVFHLFMCVDTSHNVTRFFESSVTNMYDPHFPTRPCDGKDDTGVNFKILKNLRHKNTINDKPYDIKVVRQKQINTGSQDRVFRALESRNMDIQSESSVKALLQSNPEIGHLVFNMSKQMKEHICPSTLMLNQLQNSTMPFKSQSTGALDYTILYFWFQKNGKLENITDNQENIIEDTYTEGCDWNSTVIFPNNAQVRLAINNENGRLMLTHQASVPFLDISHTTEATKSTERSATQSAPDTQTAEVTKSDSLSPSSSSSKSESLTLPVKWTANIPTEILSNVSYKWTELIANGTAGSPSPRVAHATGRVGNELFVGFGKNQNQTILSDTYIYNIISNEWRSLNFSSAARNFPQFYTSNQATWVFSGAQDTNLLEFNVTGHYMFNTTGFPYSRLSNGAMILFNNDFYIFGGYSGGYLNKTYKLSNFSIWNDISPMSSPPARVNMQFHLFEENAYIFGGYNAISFNDVWKFNIISHQWIQMNPTPDPLYGIPASRDGYASAIIEDDIFIFSGSGKPNDLWKLNIKSMSWHLVIPQNQSGSAPSRSHAASLVNFGSDFYLFGGSSNSVDYYNDLWRLRQTTVELLSTEISTNTIIAGQPFNLTWHVNTTSGAHNAMVTLDNSTYTQQFNTSTGWMILNMNNILTYNFNLTLMISDFFDPSATISQVIQFYRG